MGNSKEADLIKNGAVYPQTASSHGSSTIEFKLVDCRWHLEIPIDINRKCIPCVTENITNSSSGMLRF